MEVLTLLQTEADFKLAMLFLFLFYVLGLSLL